jgi:hypothetical protein
MSYENGKKDYRVGDGRRDGVDKGKECEEGGSELHSGGLNLTYLPSFCNLLFIQIAFNIAFGARCNILL